MARRIKRLPGHLDITVYTGYTYEQLLEMADARPEVLELLREADFLVDGPYLEAQRICPCPSGAAATSGTLT